MATGFTRNRPSPRYAELLAQYKQLHSHGERRMNLPAEKTYNGASLPRHAGRIKSLIDAHAARTVLDYGSGKGHQYHPMQIRLPDGREFNSIPAFWGIDSITCFDPAYEPFSERPEGQFDGVICTDVLEHCPEQDMRWILGELFTFARKFVFAICPMARTPIARCGRSSGGTSACDTCPPSMPRFATSSCWTSWKHSRTDAGP
jgi:hypothetical protein